MVLATGWSKLFYDILRDVPVILLLVVLVYSELLLAHWIAKNKNWNETTVSIILLLATYFILKLLQI